MPELHHVYQRAFNPDGQDSLAKIARQIAPGSRVLDVGCGPGVLGGYLARERDCSVDGIELDAESARIAAASLRRVIVADLETGSFEGLDAPYDYVVCADVLEHLRDPGAVVQRMQGLLARHGKLLLSIPNVGYAGLVAGLINGEFRYRPEGLLDATHLRFFTRRSLVEWLSGLGLSVAGIDTVRVELAESEFKNEGLEGFAPALRSQLLSMEDALTYQFIVEVVGVPPEKSGPSPSPSPAAALTFLTKLHWRGSQPEFDEKRSVVARPAMGEDFQRIRLSIPPLPAQQVGFRLDPADRPGCLRIYDLSIHDAAGTCMWRWNGTRSQLEEMPSSELTWIDDDRAGQLMVCLGDDPWFELPFRQTESRALADGGWVQVDLSWPQSTDSMAVMKRVLRSGLREAVAEFDERRNQMLRDLIAIRDEQRYERSRFDRDRAFLERERARLDAEVRSLLEDQASELRRLREDNAALQATIRQINESLTFRLGRPVHAVVNRLRDLRKGNP